jgi:hypothetical protein
LTFPGTGAAVTVSYTLTTTEAGAYYVAATDKLVGTPAFLGGNGINGAAGAFWPDYLEAITFSTSHSTEAVQSFYMFKYYAPF